MFKHVNIRVQVGAKHYMSNVTYSVDLWQDKLKFLSILTFVITNFMRSIFVCKSKSKSKTGLDLFQGLPMVLYIYSLSIVVFLR